MSMVAAVQDTGWCPMCPMIAGPWGWVMMILVWLFWIAILAAVIWLVYRIAKGQRWLGSGRGGDRAEEIARERYARGEIDRETYERIRADLRRGMEED